jgi:hypothetical protein
MIEIIGIITSTAASVFSVIQSVKRMGKNRKNEISKFLVAIANTIDDAAYNLSNDIVPHGTCEMMKEFSTQLPTILDGLSDKEHLSKLSDELNHAYNIESLILLNQSDKTYINELHKAAGKFRAAAVMLDIL